MSYRAEQCSNLSMFLLVIEEWTTLKGALSMFHEVVMSSYVGYVFQAWNGSGRRKENERID